MGTLMDLRKTDCDDHRYRTASESHPMTGLRKSSVKLLGSAARHYDV
jgi:hypothetical protein